MPTTLRKWSPRLMLFVVATFLSILVILYKPPIWLQHITTTQKIPDAGIHSPRNATLGFEQIVAINMPRMNLCFCADDRPMGPVRCDDAP